MLTITATSGSAISASSAICPAPRMPISSTSTSVPAGALRISSGSPISVLKFARDATVRLVRREHRQEQVLGGRLAGRAGDPDDPRVQLPAPGRGQACRAFSGSTGARTTPGPARPWRGSSPRRTRALVSTPQAPASSAWAANRPPSTLAPGSADEQRAGAGRRESIVTARRAAAWRDGESGEARPRRRDLSRGVQCFIVARARRRSTGASPQDLTRDGHIVERDLAAASNSWPCSWPLPAMTTTSPGARRGDGALDGRAAVDLVLDARRRCRRGSRR